MGRGNRSNQTQSTVKEELRKSYEKWLGLQDSDDAFYEYESLSDDEAGYDINEDISAIIDEPQKSKPQEAEHVVPKDTFNIIDETQNSKPKKAENVVPNEEKGFFENAGKKQRLIGDKQDTSIEWTVSPTPKNSPR